MNITITLAASPELSALVTNLINAFGQSGKGVQTLLAPTETGGTAPVISKPKQQAPVKSIAPPAAAAAPAAVTAPTATVETVTAPAAGNGELTLEAVRAIAVPLSKAGKKDAIKKILADDYKAESVNTLDPKHYAEFIQKIQAI